MFFLKKSQLKPAVFLHIQKTAGTAIIELLRKSYGKSMTSHGDCWGMNSADLKNIKLVTGHVGYDYLQDLIRERYSFVFLREPIERILSMYSFCSKQNPDEFEIYRAAASMTLDEFVDAGFKDHWVKKNIWNNQVWQLAHGYAHRDNRTIDDFCEESLLELAMKHAADFSFIGFVESFKEDRDRVLQDIGIAIPGDDVIVNKSRKINLEDIPEGTMEKLQKLTELDKKLYDYIQSKRAKSN